MLSLKSFILIPSQMNAKGSIEALAKKGEKNILKNMFRGESDSSDCDSFSDEEDRENASSKISDDCPEFDSIGPTVSEAHRSIDGTKRIILQQQKQRGIAHQLWPAATFLCNYIEKNTDLLVPNISCANIIELGAGIGLCGIFAASLGCQKVVVTDLEEALATMTVNIQLNQLETRVQAHELCWGNLQHLGTVLELFEDRVSNPPIVIAADCVYWECLFQPFYHTVHEITKLGMTVIIAHVRRWKKDGKFFAMCKKTMNVDILEEVVDSVVNEVTSEVSRRVTRIYRISPK